jgi:hypothetical protein
VVQAQGDLDDAKKLLDQFEKRLPKRSEVGYWRKKLTPELVPEPAPEPEKGGAGDGKKQEPPPATGDGKKDGEKEEEDADE